MDKLGVSHAKLVKFFGKSRVLLVQVVLLSLLPINLNVQVSNLLREFGHHLVVFSNLRPQLLIQSFHIFQLIGEIRGMEIVISFLIPQLLVICLAVSESFDLKLKRIHVKSFLIELFFLLRHISEPCSQLICISLQAAHFLGLVVSVVLGDLSLALSLVKQLQIMVSFTLELPLQRVLLVGKVLFQLERFFAHSCPHHLVRFSPSVLSVGIKPIVLRVHPLLHLLFKLLLPTDRLHLKSSLLVVNPLKHVSFSLHLLLVILLLRKSLLTRILALHALLQFLDLLFLLELDLALE